MSSVQVSADGRAVIGAGARLIDVHTALAQAGRCLPAGGMRWDREAFVASSRTMSAPVADSAQIASVCDGLTVGDGAYVNYLDDSMPDWARAYYGDNLPRLRQVAQHYDLDRLCIFPQAITNS